ncbi:MAG: DUF697 domain-containing protein [Devosia sp.]
MADTDGSRAEPPPEDPQVVGPDPAETKDEAGVTTKNLKPEALEIVNRHSAYGLASGVIPIPLVDLTVASTIQLRMIAQLAELYGIPFHKQVAKSTISSVAASALPITGAGAAATSLARAVPVVGPVLGLATLPALYSAVTYALGRTFGWHFANGGTLETIDPKALRERFRREFKAARNDDAEEATAA